MFPHLMTDPPLIMPSGFLDPPFPQEGSGQQATQAMFKKIKKGEYEFDERWWSEVSPEAKDLISKLMTVDPGVPSQLGAARTRLE